MSKTSQRPQARDGIASLIAYSPGKTASHGDKLGKTYKLSSNESALGTSPAVHDVFTTAEPDFHLYPDGNCTELRHTLAEHHGLDASRIVCGAGSDELLQLLCQGYLNAGDSIVQSQHGFLVYAIAARACGAEVRYADEVSLTANVDNILELVDETTKLVFLANPNNPTGTYLPDTEIIRLHEGLPSTCILVLDHAYAEYVEVEDYHTGFPLVEDASNVVVTRTFSKIYGLGGMRLGWCYAPADIVHVLNTIRGPFNVSTISQRAGVVALSDQDFVEQNRELNRRERQRMVQQLRGFGLMGPDSIGNFLLVECPDREGFHAHEIFAYLAENGIMVREMTNYGFQNHLRISIGSEDANSRLIELLAQKFDGTV